MSGRDVRTISGSRTRWVELRTIAATKGLRPSARVWFITEGGDESGRLDAIAGCEFVDDRIRLADDVKE